MPELAHLFIYMIDDLLKEADERIGFGLDICNGENEIAEQVGTGCYITYEYNHSEKEVWRFVMLDDKEKAKLLAEEWRLKYARMTMSSSTTKTGTSWWNKAAVHRRSLMRRGRSTSPNLRRTQHGTVR